MFGGKENEHVTGLASFQVSTEKMESEGNFTGDVDLSFILEQVAPCWAFTRQRGQDKRFTLFRFYISVSGVKLKWLLRRVLKKADFLLDLTLNACSSLFRGTWWELKNSIWAERHYYVNKPWCHWKVRIGWLCCAARVLLTAKRG